ncbi:hypothetical protein [Paraburkholderia bannensis]|uniref:hypothetical protein n=1 Tax=Paraburkholderia bannensis TaxID=765414 RepID=UPI003906CFBC
MFRRHHLVVAPCFGAAHVHVLNEAQIDPQAAEAFRDRQDLVVDRIQADGLAPEGGLAQCARLGAEQRAAGGRE